MIPGTWQQVSIAALVIFALIAAAVSFRPRRRNRRVRPRDDERGPWPIADYSEQYRKHVERLGSRYLLAKPINRRNA